MATPIEVCILIPFPLPEKDVKLNCDIHKEDTALDSSQRVQCLRAAVLGANEGLVSVASLMMGVGAIKEDATAMILIGFAGLVAGACSMGIREFVSVCGQRNIELDQIKRQKRGIKNEIEEKQLPKPVQAAVAAAFDFTFGAIVPILAAAFIANHKLRLGVVVAAVSLALVVFGAVAAELGKAPLVKTCSRVVVGGWLAMAITFALTKLISGSSGFLM